MRFSGAVIALATTLFACSGPNMMPAWSIDIVPSYSSEAEQVAAIAHDIGLVPRDVPPASLDFGGGRKEKRLQVWEWPSHAATSLGLFQNEQTQNYHIILEDSQSGGLELVGESCAKYLDLVRAMKARFGAARLRFYKETCDPGRQ